MVEFELKLGVPADRLDTLRRAFVLHGAQPQRLRACYFDTAAGLLAGHRMALRLRLEDGRWVQTLKTAGDGIVHRQEHEVPIDGPAEAMPALDPGRHADSTAGRLLRSVLTAAGHPRLLESLSTDMLRLCVMLHTTCGTTLEAALDVGEVRAAGRASPVVEAELEHKGGPLQGVFDVAGDWIRHGGLWLSTLTKAERGERLLRRASARRAGASGRPAPLDREAPAVRHPALMEALRPLLGCAGDVAEGRAGPADVRRMAAALRRLRAAVGDAAPSAQAWQAVLAHSEAALRGPAASGTAATSAVRDRRLQSALVEIMALAHGAAA